MRCVSIFRYTPFVIVSYDCDTKPGRPNWWYPTNSTGHMCQMETFYLKNWHTLKVSFCVKHVMASLFVQKDQITFPKDASTELTNIAPIVFTAIRVFLTYSTIRTSLKAMTNAHCGHLAYSR